MTAAHTDENGITVIVTNNQTLDKFPEFSELAKEIIKKARGKEGSEVSGEIFFSDYTIDRITPTLHRFKSEVVLED